MTDAEKLCEDCGYPDNSFACKIRHVQMNPGQARASRDDKRDFGLTEQR